ncbi:hypothetical protein FRC12_000622 [Ceratobasidium sp. 428]|nr:hypothetical protein FRC12_000622 [Ceratobasidium sp. 428]
MVVIKRESNHHLSSVITPQKPVSRHRLSLQDRLAALSFYDANKHQLSQSDIAAHLRSRGYETVSQSTISRWRRDKEVLQARAKNPNELRFKRIRQTEYPDVDRALQIWILQILGSSGHARLTGTAIRLEAQRFAQMFGHSDFLSLSNGWLKSLKSRMGLQQHRFHSEVGSVPIEALPAADTSLPTEQELSVENIVKQVKEEENQAETDRNGEFLYEENSSKGASQPLINSVDLQSRNEALASLEIVQAFLARFGPLNPSDLAALSRLQRKITTLGAA